jgi:hypothetical protein
MFLSATAALLRLHEIHFSPKGVYFLAKRLGPLVFTIGFVCLGVSLFEFFTLDEWETPHLFWLAFGGMPLIFIGFVLSGSSIQRFLLHQQRDHIRETMKVMGEGLREGLKETNKTCSNCSIFNETFANYCSNCGASLHK